MGESFLQFAARKPIPYIDNQNFYMMNPGSLLTTRMALHTPIGFSGTCTRFRFVVRGRWGSFFDFEKIIIHMTKNGKNCHEGYMVFYPTGNLGVLTRHQTVFPNLYFEGHETIGIRIETGGLSSHLQAFYVSAIVNFSHA